MKKALFLLVLFVAVSTVTFGQTQQTTPTTIDVVNVEPYTEAPKNLNDKATPSSSTTMTNLATKTPVTKAPVTKTSAKGCCGMNGEKHVCCAGMSKSDYKKWRKKKSKESSAL